MENLSPKNVQNNEWYILDGGMTSWGSEFWSESLKEMIKLDRQWATPNG